MFDEQREEDELCEIDAQSSTTARESNRTLFEMTVVLDSDLVASTRDLHLIAEFVLSGRVILA